MISSHIAHAVRAIPPSGIRAFFDLVAACPDAISLGIGEPDSVTPWAFREAAIHAIERGRTAYTSTLGLLDLRRAIADYLRGRFGVRFDPRREILVTVGVSQALDLAVRAITNPGDEIIVVEPSFVAYSPVVTLAGGRPVPLATRAGENWRVDIRRLARLITPRTRAILLNSPCNPTGSASPREEMEAVAHLAQRNDLLLLSDEIYAELTFDGEHTCLPALGRAARARTLLLSGLSKGWAMTGWRVGYVCGHAALIAAMAKIHQHTMMCVATPSQWAAVEALRAGEGEVAIMREAYRERRDRMMGAFREMGLPCVPPRGAFYAFPSIASTGLTSQEFARRLLSEERVAVVPGDAFGAPGEGHVRCAFAASFDRVDEAMDRMARFVERLR
ncbi:MAG: aminotransferase class I/II-fold pyridoxal phosphate-dependent enzyme [Candidatus Sumerlaeia bacterium]|nr:aminotransferase class I/II-fold pyridoxal phosphate-dependent enzyme [Candidatus Sumerlaeia bacterium]